MGEPGEAGDPDLIEQLAARLGAIYLEMLNWADDLRERHTPSTEGTQVLFALSRYATQPIQEVRAFTQRYRNYVDGITEKLAKDEQIENVFQIQFIVPEDAGNAYDDAFEAFIDANS